jgi:hypothetical protein
MTALEAYERQVARLPEVLQEAECGLIAVGRLHAQSFDGGNDSAGGGVQRVLAELRKLASSRAYGPQEDTSELARLRARKVAGDQSS